MIKSVIKRKHNVTILLFSGGLNGRSLALPMPSDLYLAVMNYFTIFSILVDDMPPIAHFLKKKKKKIN